jgi:hypothetical protein
MEVYQKAQEILKEKYHVPYQLVNGIKNPLAGLVKCGFCGMSMVLRPYGKQLPHLICYNRFCQNKSTRFDFVEERLIQSLQVWLDEYKGQLKEEARPEDTSSNKIELYEITIKNLQTELKNLETQKGRLHDLLERGIYDEETYLVRSKNIAQRISDVRAAIEKTYDELEKEKARVKSHFEIIPRFEDILSRYWSIEDPALKNSLLKSIIDYCEYRKEKHRYGDDFDLDVYPKI